MNIRNKWVLWIFLTLVMIINIVSLWNSRGFDRALKIVDVGDNLEKKGDVQGALQKYEEAVKIYSKSAYVLAFLGRAYHEIGNDEKALEIYQAALKQSPRHYWIHYLIGQMYRDEHHYNEAIKKFDELISMQDNWYNSNKIYHYTHYQDIAYGELGYCYAKCNAPH